MLLQAGSTCVHRRSGLLRSARACRRRSSTTIAAGETVGLLPADTVPASLKALVPSAAYGDNDLADCGPKNGNVAECQSLLAVAQTWALFDGSGGGVWLGLGGTDYCRKPSGPWPGLLCSDATAVVSMCAQQCPAQPNQPNPTKPTLARGPTNLRAMLAARRAAFSVPALVRRHHTLLVGLPSATNQASERNTLIMFRSAAGSLQPRTFLPRSSRAFFYSAAFLAELNFAHSHDRRDAWGVVWAPANRNLSYLGLSGTIPDAWIGMSSMQSLVGHASSSPRAVHPDMIGVRFLRATARHHHAPRCPS